MTYRECASLTLAVAVSHRTEPTFTSVVSRQIDVAHLPNSEATTLRIKLSPYLLFCLSVNQVRQHSFLPSGMISEDTGPAPPLFGSWAQYSFHCWVRLSLLPPWTSSKTKSKLTACCPKVRGKHTLCHFRTSEALILRADLFFGFHSLVG